MINLRIGTSCIENWAMGAGSHAFWLVHALLAGCTQVTNVYVGVTLSVCSKSIVRFGPDVEGWGIASS